MSNTTTEGVYSGDFLKEEFSQNFCREKKTILAGSGGVRTLLAGTVAAQLKTGAATELSANTGDGTVTLGAIGPKALTGAYVLTCISEASNGGVFEVETPDGLQLATNVVVGGGATNVDDHFTITIADGSADWDIDDVITVTVSDGKVVAYDDTATNTTKTPIGIVVADCSAADGADGVGVVLTRGPAIITKDRLIFPSTADTTDKAAVYEELLKRNILAVEGV
jgi:hypothetical protein